MQETKNKTEDKMRRGIDAWQKKLRVYASCLLVFFTLLSVPAEEAVLKTGISIDKVPKDFYGTWRVASKLISTNAKELFKENNVDLWNLSRSGNVITLDNPLSGAKASIIISNLSDRSIKFKKVGDYESKKLTDTVQLTLGKNTFKGVNNLKLDTISEIDGHVLKTEWATYDLSGEKISGEAIK